MIAKAPIMIPSLGISTIEYNAMVRQRDAGHRFYITAIENMYDLLKRLANIEFSTDAEEYEELSPILDEVQEALTTLEVK